MGNIRIYELAKKLGVTNNDILDKLKSLGIKGKVHSSSIEDSIAQKVTLALKHKKEQKSEPKVKTKVELKAKARVESKAKIRTESKPKTKTEPKTKAETKVRVKPGLKAKAKEQPVAELKAEIKPEHKVKPQPEIKAEPKPVIEHELKAEHGPEPQARPELEIKKEAKVEPMAEVKVEEEGKPETEVPKETERRISPFKFEDEEEVAKVLPSRFRDKIQPVKIKGVKPFPPSKKKWQEFKPFHRKIEKPKDIKQTATVIPLPTQPRRKVIKLTEGMTAKDFAAIIGQKINEVLKKFIGLGSMATINQPVDMDAAILVADSFGIKAEFVPAEAVESILEEGKEDESLLKPRPPVVTIMGHVDHGKTSLLDAIRETKVVEAEAGGITQHIGAYNVKLKDKVIVFLDTPGHEAFTAMRARGAKVTDIVVLVVAADDGVMPQTVEAINHAKAAQVPIIVAINKIDKPEANPARVKQQLAEHGLIPEEWGGQTIFAEVSAKKRTGIENLLQMIALQADIMELKANPDKQGRGVIVEAKLDKGRGPVATVLVQSGTIKVGDAFISGSHFGRVRALINDTGKKLTESGPSTPVEIIGLSGVPQAGDTFIVVEDERRARQIALSREQKMRDTAAAKGPRMTLDDLYTRILEGEVKELNLIIKGDVQGSVEAVGEALERLSTQAVRIKVIHSSVGGITETDVMLASASNAIIIGFNVRPESKAYGLAEKEGVDIRSYTIIYDAISDVKAAMEGLLEPTLKEKVLGKAEVRQTFSISKIGTIAGCYVIEGTVSRSNTSVRVLRDHVVIYEGKLASLKRFKDDVKEVQAGYECGMSIENFNDIKVGDILEVFTVEKIAAKL